MFGMNGWCKEPNNAGNGSDCPKNAQNSEDRTTGDLISRAEAIDDLHGKDPSQIWDTADIEVWVNALPSAQPERKTGKWLREIGAYLGGYPRYRYHCSVCGNVEEHVYADSKCANFCPNCGADMREVDDESN